jgi:hypothetical protein
MVSQGNANRLVIQCGINVLPACPSSFRMDQSPAARVVGPLSSFPSSQFSAVKAGVAAATTKAVGEGVISHYRDLSPLP